MLANFGFGALFITFLVSIYGVIAAVVGVRRKSPDLVESARLSMLLTFPLLTISSLVLVYLLVNGSYEVKYVALVTSDSMPTYLKITALWGGQSGSLLFWSWMMAAFTTAVTLRRWDRDRELLPWVIVVSLVTLGFFLFLIVFFENPFLRIWQTGGGRFVDAMFRPEGASLFIPRDGNGLNPLLRHPGMIIHPPMLYLGFVSFVIPYAFAIGALITGRTDDRWIRVSRRWTLWAWLFLSLGLVLGSRWAYDVLGWGGYWAWDPVEIAAFMPWLTGTAFLHSVMIQEKRGMFKHWNMLLIILTYSLVIFGTFLTRSGVLSSVHAFAQSEIGPSFFVFIATTLAISLALLLHRWNVLKSDTQMTSLLSREALFTVNNLLFVSIMVICFWGVMFPLISELFTGQKVTVGPPFYQRATGPLFAGLLLLMGIAPLAAWRHSTVKTLGRALWKPLALTIALLVFLFVSGVRHPIALLAFGLSSLVITVTLYEFWRGAYARYKTWGENLFLALWKLAGRDRRRYGGYTIHLGVVLMAIGIIGIEVFQTETQATIPQGGEVSLGNYRMTFDSLALFNHTDGRHVTRAVVSVYENERYVGELYPRRDYYYESGQPMTIAGVRSTMVDDFYVLLIDWQPITAQGATFKIYHNPLINWLWMGSFVFILGTMVAAWPDKDPVPAAAPQRKRSQVRTSVKA
jgi:cytochrome c-type biogenesis protein CcmF